MTEREIRLLSMVSLKLIHLLTLFGVPNNNILALELFNFRKLCFIQAFIFNLQAERVEEAEVKSG